MSRIRFQQLPGTVSPLTLHTWSGISLRCSALRETLISPMPDTSDDEFDHEEEGSPDAEEPVDGVMYNPDVVSHVGLGSVESVEMFNFMCHEHFEIKFGPQVNFVIGRNGSGKSAILTALVVCFGGRAGVTNRGKAVKSFIRKGTTAARVVVQLCNHSNNNTDFSYKYDAYGRKISIERLIKSDGSSSYVIRNSGGSVMDRSKKELDCIIRHFSIQIDNPVVILNQEVSRNFLNSRNAKEKYKFFMRATNLENLKDNLIQLKNRLDWAKKTKDDKQSILPELEYEVTGLKKKMEHLKSVKGYRDKKVRKEHELLWAYVLEKEFSLKDIEKGLAVEVKKLDLLKKNADEYDGKIAGLRDDQQNLNQKLQEQNERVNVATRDVLAARKEVDRLEKEKQEISFKMRYEKLSIREEDEIIQKLEVGIQAEIDKQGDPAALKRQREARQEKIMQLTEEEQQMQESLKEKAATATRLKEWLATNQAGLDSLAGDRSHLKRQVDGIQKRISEMDSSQGDTRAMFGAYVPKVNSLIDEAAKAGRFNVKPIGPIGQYIQLKDRSVSTALQAVMKGLVRAYAVDNFEDQSVLRDIFKKAIPDTRQFPQIITRRFGRFKFNVSGNQVQDEEVKSMIEYVTVSDVNAFNVLIDKTSLETVAYIPDRKEAERLLLNIRTVPRNCRKAYSQDGTEYNPTTRTKGFSMYPNEFQNRPDVFSMDFAGQVDHLRRELKLKEEELEKTMAKGRILKSSIENREDQVKSLESESVSIRIQLKKVTQELTALKDYVEPEPMSVASLQVELDEHREQKSSLEAKISAFMDQISEKQNEIREARTCLEAKEEAKSDATEKLKLCADRRAKLAEDIQNMETSRSQREVNRQTEKVQDLQLNRDAVAKEVDDLIGETSQTCERIETRRKPEDLKHQIKELTKLITDCEKETGTEKEVTDRYNKANNNLIKVKGVIEVVTACIVRCTEMLKKRRDLYYKSRGDIVTKMKAQFAACLDVLGYSGSLEIEHGGRDVVNNETVTREPKLNLKVNPKGSHSSHLYSDTRSLSGGERSFSTVAFLLALWEGCCSPFRILDEVDVFMDMVTRQVAMDALVAAAKDNKRQYIFLSPLPLIQDHTEQDNIVIYNMPEPIRVGDEPPEADL